MYHLLSRNNFNVMFPQPWQTKRDSADKTQRGIDSLFKDWIENSAAGRCLRQYNKQNFLGQPTAILIQYMIFVSLLNNGLFHPTVEVSSSTNENPVNKLY